MMLGRQRASVEEGRGEGGRVGEGNERGRDGTRHGHGQREGGSEQRRHCARKGGSTRVREGNFKGGILKRAYASSQYIHKPSDNASLAIDTLLLQIKNREHV